MALTNNHDQIVHLFRHSYGKIIAILVNKFGPAQLENIEDAVQDALIKAMKVWSYQGIPNNPLAWMLRVSQNQLIDFIRRQQRLVYPIEVQDHEVPATIVDDPTLESTLHDDQLKMIFICCHPALSQESQIILTLKLVCGFGNKEVAHALLKNEEAIAKAYTRAKQKLQNEKIHVNHDLEIGLRSRLNIVLKIIYLLFSEGYKPHQGHTVIKRDLCYEAIRLALLLDANKHCQSATTKSLVALMCFHTSRFDARQNEDGEIVDLQHQDRSLWNRQLIRIGIEYLNQATNASDDPLDYILQAFISYYHCMAPSFDQTDWQSILRLYDIHLAKQYSPIVALNRLIPLSMVRGLPSAIQQLKQYEEHPHTLKNMLFYAIKGELFQQTNQHKIAIEAYRQAVSLGENEAEIKHFKKKISSLENH